MTTKTPIKRTPVRDKTSARKSGKAGKLRPQKGSDQKLKHGVSALDRLLKADLDGRLSIARKRDALEAELVGQVGRGNLTPTLILLIKRIVTKALVCDQSEKMALLNEYNLSDKRYIALSNSLRRDLVTFESMLRQQKPKVTKSLEQYVAETYGVSDK